VRVRALPLTVAVVLLAGGCTSSGAEPREPGDPAAASAVTVAPAERLTVVADPDPVAAAVSASRALFERAPVVVVARDGDRAGTLLAASAAVGLGVPLLLEPGDGAAADALATELTRLDAGAVLAVGEARDADGDGREVASVPADPGAVADAIGLDLGRADEVPADGDAAAVAGLDPARPVALEAADAPDPGAGGEGTVPPVGRPEPLSGTVVMSTGEPGSVAGIATARAAGARVELTGGGTDPRGSDDVVAALAEPPVEAVVALGAGFADEDGLDWKVATAASGARLPGGGQLLFPGRMIVALYGHPGSGALGVLGEQDLTASIDRARAHAAPYESLVDVPVVPAFEIIATVASSAAGPDGDYSAETDPAELRPWVEAAGEAGLYVVLDLQPGRTDFVTQAERYRSLLELPYVGLALDPEWRLGPDQVHGAQIGSVGVDEINDVVTWLADLTREHALPQKLLVLHQFQTRMIDGRERLDTSRDELAVMVHADGQGSQGDKQATWRALHGNAPAPLAWGWKNFYDEDAPMLTPEQTVSQVVPRPDLVSYQ
jgi:hypothetical protein